jgi:hypothetical protein
MHLRSSAALALALLPPLLASADQPQTLAAPPHAAMPVVALRPAAPVPARAPPRALLLLSLLIPGPLPLALVMEPSISRPASAPAGSTVPATATPASAAAVLPASAPAKPRPVRSLPRG